MSTLSRPYLGELELAVLEQLWSRGPLDAKTMHRRVGTLRRIGLNTVQSTLERLFRKQLVTREKVSHAYLYAAGVRREELMERLIEEIVETFSDGSTEHMLTAFVDLAARVDTESLSRLEHLIAERRAQVEDRDEDDGR
ncbi:MAG: BlaI/MecI/CopY family transcriptional regulator [Xanthomonadales bacterium]|nr:BlaI/MecI/CopY family transcriptional regulator [Xanthomonadales bacterium]